MKKCCLFIVVVIAMLCFAFSACAKTEIDINEEFPDSAFRTYVKKFDTDGNEKFSVDELAEITEIYASNLGIKTLKGVEHFSKLKKLVCDYNELTSLDVSHNAALTLLCCDWNNITELKVTDNPELESISCDNNQIASLDLRKNTKLESIICRNNKLKALNVDNNSAMSWIVCGGNEISSLNVSNNPELYVFLCNDNQLTSLDVSNNPKLYELTCSGNKLNTLKLCDNGVLESLVCSSNQLTTLDVSRQALLRHFECSDNKLTRLDVTQITKLENFDCTHNKIKTINLGKNGNLFSLKCSFNEIATLDVSYTLKLGELMCTNNQLSSLDVSNNIELFDLRCEKNQLTSLDVSKNTELKILCCEDNKLKTLDISKCPYLVKLVTENKTTGSSPSWVLMNENGLQTLMADMSVRIVPGWEPVLEPGSDPEPEPKPEPADKVEAYVSRCYQIILGREPDAGGMKTWYNELISGRKAAAEIIDNFVRSQEFIGKNYSNAEAVEILYKAMLGRGSDPAGKADWVGKLDAGHPFAVVINGFCGSKEFKEICDSYGITPGSVSMEQGSASDQQIRAFVTRCYNIILGRGADEVGMNTWFNELKSRRRTAAEIIEQFVYSQEFQNKKYSNPDAVEILYKAMLGRGSDPAGKADWVGRLAGGQPLTAIINGFCGSMEFTAICEAYGITPGSVQVQSLNHQTEIQEEPVVKQTVTKTENNVTKVEIVNPSDTENEQLGTAVQAIYVNEEKAKEFIGRCYRCILGREASQTELEGWIGQMLNGTKTADQIARGFLFSGEFKDKNVGNEELVKILYRVYLNREADAEGLATWMQKLDEGTSLQALLDTFSKTNELRSVVAEMSK